MNSTSLPTVLERWRSGLVLDVPNPVPQGRDMSREYMTGEQFRQLRERLGMTQPEMAAWGDVTVRTIQRFESGDQPIPKIWRLALGTLERA